MQIEQRKLTRFWLGIIAVSGIAFLVVFCLTWLFFLPDERIAQGVKVGRIDVGGQTITTGARLINKYEEKNLSLSFTVLHQDKSWLLNLDRIGFYLDEEEAVKRAFKIGRTGKWWNKLQERGRAKLWGLEVPIVWQYDEEKALSEMAVIIEEVERPAQSASLQIIDDQVEIIQGVTGIRVNEKELLKLLQEQLAANRLAKLKLPVAVEQPEISTEEILKMRIDTLLAKFITRFNSKVDNRVHNIKMAAARIDGYLLPPGVVFSFNEIVGPRTIATGFREAPVIVDNKLTAGIGGGICQVSSTLYNGALLANLPIVERRRHSLQVDYIPVGIDATVVYGHIDLKFKNNTDSYLLIKTKVKEDQLEVLIFGNGNFKKEVEVKRIIEEVLAPKSQGKQGYRTKVMRLIREAGEIIFEEVISEDLYPPEEKVILTSPNAPIE